MSAAQQNYWVHELTWRGLGRRERGSEIKVTELKDSDLSPGIIKSTVHPIVENEMLVLEFCKSCRLYKVIFYPNLLYINS